MCLDIQFLFRNPLEFLALVLQKAHRSSVMVVEASVRDASQNMFLLCDQFSSRVNNTVTNCCVSTES